MTGFDNLVTDITLSGRAAATVTSLRGSGTTYTANIAPTSNGNLKISVPKNAAKDKANNGNTASQTHTVAISLTGPSVAIQGVPTDPQNSAFTVTITFSESVTGFMAADISLGTGVSATVTSLTGSGTTYTATITPAPNVEEGITLSVPASAAQNAANMGNTASSEYPIRLDKVQPSVTITAPGTAVTAFDVTITFSEDVTGFAQNDISLTDSTATAALAGFTIENAKEYTATITPTSNGNVVIAVPAGVAKDAADNQNTTSDKSTVTVALNNAPAFNTGLNTTPMIAENTAAGTNIGTPLTAMDADIGNMLTYSLKAHTEDADDYLAFDIDSMGQLKTKADLDFETQSTYKVTVQVSDSIATDSITVTINITDVNEAPTFPATTDTTLEIAENTAAGENIGTAVAATDPDTADGDTDVNPTDPNVDSLTYSLDAASDAVFDIDSTGQLKTQAALDYETTTSYTVTVTTSDGEHSVSINITIDISDVDDTPPTVSIDAVQTVKDDPQRAKFEITITFSEAVTGFTASDITLTTTLDTGTGSATATLKNASDGDTVYTAEITPPANAEGEVKIQVPAGAAQDAANQDNIASSEFTVDIDTKSPTVTITDVPSATQNDTFEVTITFSEGVTLTGSGNITTTDSVSRMYSLSPSEDGTTYAATFSRVDGKDGDVKIKVPAGFAKDGVGNLNVESTEHTVAVDWKDPTVTVAVPSGTQTAAFDVTITFSEDVTGFEASDISLSGTASATATLTGSGMTYAANITPTSSGNVKIKVDADAAEDAAGNGNTESDEHTVQVNLLVLTVTITGVPTTPQNSAFEIVIEFSETVTGFDASDISLGTNVSATVSLTGSGTTYTATITPAANVEEEIVISVPAGAAQNTANTDNEASAEHRVQLDTVKPTLTLTGPSGTQTGAFDVTITFLEVVTGFEASDISLSGTASATASLTGSGTTYTATVTPTTDGNVVFKIDADIAVDAAGNGNVASDTLTVEVDLSVIVDPDTDDTVDRPDPIMYVKQDGVVQHNQTVAVKPFELIIKFGEPVTGFEQSDLRLSNSGVTITGWVKSDDNKTYTVTVKPTSEGSVTFTVPENVAHAADDGQGNVQRKLNVQVDADHDPAAAVNPDETAPHVRTIQTPSGMQAGAFQVTITFSESVTGFEVGDITLSGTANANVTALTGSGSVYTATITPEADADGDVLIQVSAGAVKDKAENENPASTTYSVRVNLTRPTVEITNVPTDPQNSAFSVTITFSKLVTGFEVGDIVLGGTGDASVTALTGSEGIYTATITPIRSGEVSIQVRPNAARDSGNRGNIASSTHTVSADLTRPTVTITDVPTTTQSGWFTLTITFSEAVTGFRANDLSLTNATATLARSSDSTFSASITPTSSGDVSVQVPENVAQDAAGNGNERSQSHTVSANLGEDSGSAEIDSRLDPIMVAMQNGVEKRDQTVAPGTFQLIVDFGQPVTGFERVRTQRF